MLDSLQPEKKTRQPTSCAQTPTGCGSDSAAGGHPDVRQDAGQQSADEGVIDVGGSLRRMGGDWDLFREFVVMFDEDGPPLLEQMETAVGKNDAAGLHRAAHTFKGLVLNFGARQAADAAYTLERMSRANDLDGAPEAVRSLEAALVRLNAALEPHRPQRASSTSHR
jgi:HPt (histidine-containing phosphotransfer) domain-containing protein